MATNDFKPFANALGARVMAQATWEAQENLVNGFAAGVLTKEKLNKALRQPSVIAAAVAQYVSNVTGEDMLDDGNLAGLVVKMTTAFGAGSGGPGLNAQLLTLGTTGYGFIATDVASTAVTGPTITFTAFLQNVTGTVTFVATAKNAAGANLGTITLGGTSPNATLSAAQFTTFPLTRYVTVVATIPGAGGSTLTDQVTVTRVDNGSDALEVRLTNESHTVASLADGTVLSYSGASGIMEAYKGALQLTAGSVPSVAFSLVGYTGFNTTYPAAQAGISVNPATGAYSVIGNMLDTQATVTIRATLSTGQTRDAVFSLGKSLKGTDGATGTAPLVSLNAPSDFFMTPANSSTPSPVSLTITATVANIPGPTYQFLVDGAVVQTGASTTLVVTAFASGLSKLIRCNVTGSNGATAFDTMTLFSLKNGDNAVVMMLSNENQTIACDSAGTPKVGGGLPATSQATLYLGTAVVAPAGITFSIAAAVGVSGVSVNAAGLVTITGITATSGSATVRATYNGVAYDRVITLNKSLDGTIGTNGTPGARGTVKRYISPFSAWDNAAATASVPGGVPITGDEVTEYNGTTFAETRTWNGTAWILPGTVINGSALVRGTVTANALVANTITAASGVLAAASVGSLTIEGNAVTVPASANTGAVETQLVPGIALTILSVPWPMPAVLPAGTAPRQIFVQAACATYSLDVVPVIFEDLTLQLYRILSGVETLIAESVVSAYSNLHQTFLLPWVDTFTPVAGGAYSYALKVRRPGGNSNRFIVDWANILVNGSRR